MSFLRVLLLRILLGIAVAGSSLPFCVSFTELDENLVTLTVLHASKALYLPAFEENFVVSFHDLLCVLNISRQKAEVTYRPEQLIRPERAA